MISVTINKHENQYKGFVVDGHAGFASFGKDIVCASVSVLTINCVNSIEQFTDDHIICEVDTKKNNSIKLELPDNISDKTILLIDSMVLGLEEIQKQYGSKYIKLHYKEV